ncbi:hypothetical protein JAAARDRAFT_195966 [Jaapia argillacea MUCL 33604]|uniref:MI domain-containing protein n=1 Tax=Jaapia argillacea MUCL 33604 TaxID=933084 RepID=A0A067PJK6_9AGAM|nr:hypothetical protein JAAARDRAFT_195966 [Jaapia argillacea MUCL 33604]
MSSTRSPEPVAIPRWAPWSIPVHPVLGHKTLRGLLNKIAAYNFVPVSDKIVELFLRWERSGTSDAYVAAVRCILERGITDVKRLKVYASLCQKIVDELEREENYWDLMKTFDGDDRSNAFLGTLTHICMEEFQGTFQQDNDRLVSLAAFVGELLAHGALLPADMLRMVEPLFKAAAENDRFSSVALFRLLSAVLKGATVKQIMWSLDVVNNIQDVLQTATIPMVRYLMLALLDKITGLEPADIFGSSEEREEIYGFMSGGNEDMVVEEPQTPISPSTERSRITLACDEGARVFLATRSLGPAEAFFQTLLAKDRHIFVRSLVQAALLSNEYSDAELVATLFSLESVRALCGSVEGFTVGFVAEIEALEGIVLDCPFAYRLAAMMLHACGLSKNAVEDIASRIIIPDNPATQRFLAEYSTIGESYAHDVFDSMDGGGESGERSDTSTVMAYAV